MFKVLRENLKHDGTNYKKGDILSIDEERGMAMVKMGILEFDGNSDAGFSPDADDEYKDMDISWLRNIAKSKKVDLKGLKEKDDIIEAIEESESLERKKQEDEAEEKAKKEAESKEKEAKDLADKEAKDLADKEAKDLADKEAKDLADKKAEELKNKDLDDSEA